MRSLTTMRPGATATMSICPKMAQTSAIDEQCADRDGRSPRRRMHRGLLQAERRRQEGRLVGQALRPGQLVAALPRRQQHAPCSGRAVRMIGCGCDVPCGAFMPARPLAACATGAHTAPAPLRSSRSCGPISTMRPLSITTMRWAWRTALRRCAMTITVRPLQIARHVALHDRLALVVERAGGLVEDQDARVGEQRPRDRDALALAAGEARALLADHRVVALGQLADEVMGAGKLRSVDHRLDRRCRVGDRDVLAHAAVEEQVLLQHHADLPSQLAPRSIRPMSMPSTSTRPCSGTYRRCTSLVSVLLPEPRAADDADHLAGAYVEAEVCSTGAASGR